MEINQKTLTTNLQLVSWKILTVRKGKCQEKNIYIKVA